MKPNKQPQTKAQPAKRAAKPRKAVFEGFDIEQPLPGGRMRLIIGEITIEVS